MRIYELGEGTPEIAVVGGIHGDEPCGPVAIERLVAESPPVRRPVKLVVANEEALDAGVRYLDEDLNRAFPGDPDADSHERRLAGHLARELRGCTTLSLHSTQSFAEPFALVDRVDAVTRAICPRLPIDVVVETDRFTGGRLIEHAHTVEVECGLQGTDEAAENAYALVRAFLDATDVLDADDERFPSASRATAHEDGEVTVYRLLDQIPKTPDGNHEVFAANFEAVEEGESFAATDGSSLVADRHFYPVLLSPYGYEDIFGYVAERVGALS
ncbi:succinylglutamate desuccinylase [Salinigranum rubrum]|uniref:Succinylglutamate desuccinylase n=1 Tax=Salinigranum rubrum TaxID=755307 RepID=A0A2I8VKE2_9EURY|nr:succinylglutamate desuccinylase/aspartoacylase family protein [Salinigranum rubrum]AUV82396.1 succinylglutamate desuccinylase [Salinigranum rubrum]